MGNNDKDYSKYSTGYDPNAVEHDLQRISRLTHGTSYGKNLKNKLTMQQAQEIYYRIKKENIQFQSDIGENFLLSLYENMTDARMQEIDRAVQRRNQKKQNRKQFIRINRKIACVVSSVVLISSILCINWSLLMDLRTNYRTKKLQEKITEVQTQPNDRIFVDSADNTDIVKQESRPVSDDQDSAFGENQSSDVILPKFTQLYEENQDFAGWLRIPGTKIDYPVMSREGDNDYYLDKNFEQQYDKNGLLILDYRSDVRNNQQNLIIYGHNMRTGVMFGTLKNYKEKSFCDAHRIIRFDTLYEECEYKVVAAMLSSVAYEDEDVFRYYDAIDISTEENFNAFKENITSSAIYTTDETIAFGDTCLILSTCDNYKEDGRFVVIAKKI